MTCAFSLPLIFTFLYAQYYLKNLKKGTLLYAKRSHFEGKDEDLCRPRKFLRKSETKPFWRMIIQRAGKNPSPDDLS